MKRSLCVVLHDVAPATRQSCERVLRAIADVAPLPVTLLAVPRYHCEPATPAFEEWLVERYSQGDEIALHGYTHQDDGVPRHLVDHLRRRHYTRGEGEFCALGMNEALRRLTAGVRWFARMGLPLHGFVAPAWLMSRETWEALRFMNLRYTCTLRRLVLLPDRRHLTSQSVVYSAASAWRRGASLVWSRVVAASLRRNPLLRLELHPHDADHPSIRRSWQRLLAEQLEGREAVTLDVAAERFRRRSDWDLQGDDSDDGEDDAGAGDAERSAERDVARVMESEHHP
jgi:predicted deacetylase